MCIRDSINAEYMGLANEEHEFSLDDLGKRKEINIKLRRKGGRVLYVATLTDGHTKVLRITDVLSGFDVSAKDEKLEFNYFLDVRAVSYTHLTLPTSDLV
eukprot:TRINITY_DN6734_c0_g1_i1.p1 TRINITY_DN6734_c0_g1~~TRINITY_DN6734_c0_g1_i1.p1  ORF type:complete len:100 (-),score=25.55 TRINITY_DN6734_c0_g1_i1:34-333(-)